MARDTLQLPAGDSSPNISPIPTTVPSGSSSSSCIAAEKPREQDITYSSTDLEIQHDDLQLVGITFASGLYLLTGMTWM
ncbi:hypothetical protein F5882DRAFT_459466 [Hyaloscypha sp. PMI_1271]|nr:hypothetical protein F5882DRAFT_459466 [Hyaloscypha sp. PMI_1271]